MGGKRHGVSSFARRYICDGMSYMGFGLYASLMLCVIFEALSTLSALTFLSPIAAALTREPALLGAACGVAVAAGLGYVLPVVICAAVTGAMGYGLGGPLCAYVTVLLSAQVGNLIAGRTRADMLLIPLVSVIVGGIVSLFTGPYLAAFMQAIGRLIENATSLHPALMGLVVSVLVGLCATVPLGSAAICLSLGLDGLAAGAACVGCATQMVGFAICSYRENGLGGALSLAFGTAMPTFGNVLRRPLIWLPGILASAVMGPLSTVVFQMENTALGAGMGTSGLAGQVCAYWAMAPAHGAVEAIVLILLAHLVLPAILTLFFHMLLRRANLIKSGDMRLTLFH